MYTSVQKVDLGPLCLHIYFNFFIQQKILSVIIYSHIRYMCVRHVSFDLNVWMPIFFKQRKW